MRPLSKLAPASRVSASRLKSSPLTASLKLIATLSTEIVRGSGDTGTMAAVGAVVSTVITWAGESPDDTFAGSVWRAVMERSPSARTWANSPSVVTIVVGPLAIALPIGEPSEYSVTVAPAIVPPT